MILSVQGVTRKPEKINHQGLFPLTFLSAEGGIANRKAYKQHSGQKATPQKVARKNGKVKVDR